MTSGDSAVPDRVRARTLFAELSELPPDDPKRQRIRDELVELDLFGLPVLEICPWALREGVILRRLDGLPMGRSALADQ